MNDGLPGAADAGEVIAGRYRVEQALGRGGMGAVYRVHDTRSDVSLALKRGFARDPRKIKARSALLEREYHTLAQLAHPRIIEVYDYGVDAQGPYYTMELLDGADLDGQGQVPWREACALLLDVASSLAILHSRGLVHRDVSPRNVRRTADGRAKLIDFGAMVSMGVAADVVGTPPFMAPEALQNQTLDARADLFALGALGYYLLTGRHAYPARRIADLRDVWRSAPVPPARIAADIPPALNALVSQLIALDRGARPSSAAAVMARLCAIADLPAEEHGAVCRAYLTTPVLVGRDRALVAVRKRMLSLARGDGGTMLVQGAAGSGRSRLLDACALEAKLLGAIVVRADASDGEHEPWSAARALCAQLIALMPKEANEAARLSRDVLGHVIDGLGGEASAVLPERSLLIRELRDFLLTVARGQRFLIIVDDADLIDEPSAALLAALAVKTQRRHPVLLALAVLSDTERPAWAPVDLLRSLCQPIALEPLSAEETKALMRSVFGDVPNLELCASRIHGLAQGSPRVSMELAQHLCDRGLVRYEAGRFTLPGSLDEELPATLAASLSSRLRQLGDDARELACALALADSDAPELDGYAGLTSHGDARRVFRALDELVEARVLAVDARRYRFAQRGFVPLLRDGADPAQAAALHSRIANLLAATGGDVLRRVEHLFGAHRDVEAIDLLRSINLVQRLPPLELRERALDAAERLVLPARAVHELRMAVLSKAPFVMAWESFQRCVPPVLERLERESGLVRYRELAQLPEGQRLPQALLDTQQRYLDTPEHDRVYGVSEAIRELVRFSGTFCSMAASMFSGDLLDSLPSLEPLRPLSPGVELISTLVAACKDWHAGRRGSYALYEKILERVSEPDHAGLDEAQYLRTYLGLHYWSGMVDASLGLASAERHAQVLETDRELRVNAWRVRQVLKLAQGDIEEARSCARRAELMQLHEGLEPRYLNTTIGYEFTAYAMGDDMLGAKTALDRIALLAAHIPGWRPVLTYARSWYRQMQGDPQGALDMLLEGFAPVQPGRHVYYAQLAGLHLTLLCELGRFDEALEHARQYEEIFERMKLFDRDHWFSVASAVTQARAGEHARAVEILDAILQTSRERGRSGLALGLQYEARARIAIWMNDREAFERFAGLCCAEYGKAHNPALSAKFARLLEEAQGSRVAPASLHPQMLELATGAATESEYETVESRMRECVDDGDRARCALTMLLQQAESFAGYLYRVKDGEVALLAGLPERSPEAGLQQWLRELAANELAAERDATVTGEDEGASQEPPPCRYVDGEGRTFEPLWLTGRGEEGRHGPVAVLAYHVTPGPRTLPDRGMLAHIAAQLA